MYEHEEHGRWPETPHCGLWMDRRRAVTERRRAQRMAAMLIRFRSFTMNTMMTAAGTTRAQEEQEQDPATKNDDEVVKY